MVGLSAKAPECEVKVLGQILIVNPPITRPSVGFAEHPTIQFPSDGDAALMDSGVMPLTQQDQIIEIGISA